jgi:hypothetical protein
VLPTRCCLQGVAYKVLPTRDCLQGVAYKGLPTRCCLQGADYKGLGACEMHVSSMLNHKGEREDALF